MKNKTGLKTRKEVQCPTPEIDTVSPEEYVRQRVERDQLRRAVEILMKAALNRPDLPTAQRKRVEKALDPPPPWVEDQEKKSMKEKLNSGIAPNTTETFFTAGETFADGTIIELVAGSSGLTRPQLLLWNGRKATVAPRVQHAGCIYEAAIMDPVLYRAVRLPARCLDYGSARSLLTELSDLFSQHLGLPESDSSLLACFAISTWLADRLPTAPNLIITGPDEKLGIDVLRLLSCVCRHPLMLAELTPGSFRSLPMQLSLTLLLDQQRLRSSVQLLLRASSYRGMYLSRSRGRVVDLYGPKAIFCGNDSAADTLSSGVIQISLPPSLLPSSTLDDKVENEIATRFQPRLLMYRLRNSGTAPEFRVDVSEFTFVTRQLACTLAMCFPEDLKLAGDIVQLLRPQDEEVRGQHSRDVNCAIVEILLGYIHDGKQREVRVDELAKKVSALLRFRGEIRQYSPEEIGWKLRDLNIAKHTSSAGRQVILRRETSQIVHRLAQSFGLRQRVEAGCPDCNEEKATNP